jgi:hypothetical protein
MVWRASLSIAGKQSGLHFIQRAGVRLPASVWQGGAAGLRQIRPERMRTRVGMLRRSAQKPGAARGGGDWSVLFASTRFWRAFGSPLSLG